MISPRPLHDALDWEVEPPNVFIIAIQIAADFRKSSIICLVLTIRVRMMAEAKSYDRQRKGVAMPKSNYRADVIGCYAMWSPTLHYEHRRRFPSQAHTIIKIGSSEDIFGRIDNHNGIDSKYSTLHWANDRDGYAHVKDWKLWRITQELNGCSLLGRERQLQAVHSKIASFVWEDMHRKISDRKYVPAVEELFVCKFATVKAQFRMSMMPIPELGDT